MNPGKEPTFTPPAALKPPPNTAYQSGAKIIPPLIYAAVFGIGLLVQHFLPIASLSEKIGQPVAVVFTAISALLAACSFFSFWRVRTSPLPIIPSKALATTGPYRFIRNPMYVSLAFLYAGISFWFHVLWALILLPVAIAFIHYRVILREEKYLEQRFGKEYLDYKARVPRWFPRLGL